MSAALAVTPEIRPHKLIGVTAAWRDRYSLSSPTCSYCHGWGRHGGGICKCVWRSIHRQGLRKYRSARANVGLSRWAQSVMYAIDFENCAWSALAADPRPAEARRIYEIMYLHQHDVAYAERELGVDRGIIHHAKYRAEELIGRALTLRRLWPYSGYGHHEFERLPVVMARMERVN